MAIKKKSGKPYDHYKETVRLYFGAGFLLAVFGVAIMASAWPSTEVYGTFETESGSAFGAFLGAVLAMIGQIMIAIAVIACGVRLGNTKEPVSAPTS